MAEIYPLGSNRIVYRSTNFAGGLGIFVDLYGPDGLRMPSVPLTELGEGLYYFEFTFSKLGIYTGLFYENGTKRTSQNFNIRGNPDGGFRPFRGDNVINT